MTTIISISHDNKKSPIIRLPCKKDKLIKNQQSIVIPSSISNSGTQINLSSKSDKNRNLDTCSVMNIYLNDKPCSIYELPDTRIMVMKGKFFYDYKDQKYAVDPKGWWMSEKLDGIRAIWTGKELLTRTGRLIHAPRWFTDEFPKNIALDGELYLGRNQFHRVQMTVMDNHKNKYLWDI